MSAPPPTPEQATAIAARETDAFCEAGAGSGKTRVLVGRYCDALTVDGAALEEILAFTFTERAAGELRQRIRAELTARSRTARAAGDEDRARDVLRLARETEHAWVTTIHGFCRRLLGHHSMAAGLDPRFRVLDDAEAGRLREQAAREALDGLVASGGERFERVVASYQAYRVRDIVLAAHERLRSQGMADPQLPEVGPPAPGDPELPEHARRAALDAHATLQEALKATAERYEELKRLRSGLDFADLELRAVELLRAAPAIAALWQGRFRHVMVDEFQDTNRVQLELIDHLRGLDTRVFTVGDEHQSIYRFRNADLEVFREERAKARGAAATRVLALRGNFRSRPEVLAVANELGSTLLDGFTALTHGREATGEPRAELLLTLQEGTGKGHRKWKADAIDLDPPPSEGSLATVAQARALAERLRALVDAGDANPGEIVVLLRAFTHVDAYEEALDRFGLEPYVVGGRGYWSQQQVEDLLRLLQVIANPLDDEMLLGALASPACAVSPDALWLLRRGAGGGRHIWPALAARFGAEEREIEVEHPELLDEVGPDDSARLGGFCAKVDLLRGEAPVRPLDVLVERVMNVFEYDLALLARPQGAGRMANVRKLMRLAAEYERNEGRDLRGFLVQASASTRRDEREGQAPVQAEDYPGVRIMTVHGAKGLEFPVVAVPDLERGLAAGHRSADIWIGRVDPQGGQARFGLRLAFPTADSLGVWELAELNEEEKQATAEEACRLVYVAATRAQERLILSGVFKPGWVEPAGEPNANDAALRRLLPALAERGWQGGDETISLPAPAAALEGMASAPPAGLAVRVSAPSPERARELCRRAPTPSAAPGDEAGGRPPILSQRPSPVPLGHLSYSALDAFKRCGYRFYVERVLGVDGALVASASAQGEGDPQPIADPSDELGDPEAAERGARAADAKALGNAVHAALEWSARNGWATPDTARIAALLRAERAGDEAGVERARGLIDGWLRSPLRGELEGMLLRPEAPFVLALAGTVLRGSIDLLATGSAEAVVVDFKTDRVGRDDPADLGERYTAQRAVYALAAAAATGATSVRAIHVFLERPGEPVEERFGAVELKAARARLEGLIAEIRAGRFEVTHEPYAALCIGCPAAARLCPRPAWRPRSAAAAAA